MVRCVTPTLLICPKPCTLSVHTCLFVVLQAIDFVDCSDFRETGCQFMSNQPRRVFLFRESTKSAPSILSSSQPSSRTTTVAAAAQQMNQIPSPVAQFSSISSPNSPSKTAAATSSSSSIRIREKGDSCSCCILCLIHY